MKFKTKTEPLISSLELASLALAAKTTVPILTCALVEVMKKGVVSVTCDSLDARVTATFDGAKVDEAFSFLAPPRLLRAALRGEDAEILFKDGKLSIKSDGESKLATIAVDEFPKPWKDVKSAEVDSAIFLAAVNMAQNLAETNADGNTSGIFFDPVTTHIFGTDNKGLAARPVPLSVKAPFILPASQAKIITTGFKGEEGLSVGVENSVMHLSAGNRQAWIRLREGNVINHKQLLFEGPPFITVGRESLEAALLSLADFVDKDYGKVTLSPNGKGWTASSRSGDNESTVTLGDCEVAKGAEVEAFTVGRAGILRMIRFWTCDHINIARKENILMFTADDSSGCVGISAIIRQD